MKTWIKRSLIGVAASAALLGGLAAWAHKQYGPLGAHMGWRVVSEQEAAPLKARVIEMAGSRLDLDAAQKAKLGLLADAMREQRNALVGSSGVDPRTELQGLVAGNTFDRSKAQALIADKVGAINGKSPALVTALADFYDSLNPTQQAKLREYMAQRHTRGHHERGDRGGRGERGG